MYSQYHCKLLDEDGNAIIATIYLFNILISSYFVFMSTTPCEYDIANPISLPTPKVRPEVFSYFKLT